MPNAPVRVRLAPSPTGEVHIGTLWIALFNWVYAKQHHGTFVLRIEDTDQKRFVAGSADRIYEALYWLGFSPDEGPQEGGSFGPYIQRERLQLYQDAAAQLVGSGRAYYCFCTPERLEQVRAAQTAAKLPPRYDKHCATLTREEADRRRGAGESATVRLRLPETGTVTLHDLIRGDVIFKYDLLDDSVIMKSDGYPTYHLAVVVDDHAMQISHVFRAEEWLPSAPKHLFIYQALGWEVPAFAHFPLILGTDRSKMSKRHGTTSALMFRDQGYLPEAMRNFLVLMGWHPKGEAEVMTTDDVLAQFAIEDVHPSGAIFDQTKLDWLNGLYIRRLTPDELQVRLEPFWHQPADQVSPTWLTAALRLVQDRLVKLSDIDQLINFVFPSVWDSELTTFERSLLVPKKGKTDQVQQDLTWASTWLQTQSGTWTAAGLKAAMLVAIAAAGKKNGDVLWPLRVALSLRPASPDVFDLIALLGPAESQRRIAAFL
ncbi:MAG: glutamate--tRNA ligase [Candidatus Kerfeldbacteria bacterium]|nr:glutamate--tRNA ligase [Candidatus Kerfeldbacteria bacterium]